MASRIIDYFLAPFCPLEIEHVVVVFDDEDMDGTLLAYSPVEGMCRFKVSNLRDWHRVPLEYFAELCRGHKIPEGFLVGQGKFVERAKEKCNGRNNSTASSRRYLQAH